MQVPVQVTFRDMPLSDAVEAACHREAEKLDRYFDRITSCRVVVAESHHRHQKGNLYEIRVGLTVPGREIVVNREPALHHRDEDIFVALREAFDRVQRQLEDYARRRRGDVKVHEGPPRGRIVRLVPGENCGFLETLEGREIYFHRNSVVNGAFDRLAVGDEVRFEEEAGEQGPQASSVSRVGRHEHAFPSTGQGGGPEPA
jgi:ribosomal subunit interface protein